MTRQLQITLDLDPDANHRSLRRCYSCGAYSRPYDQVGGSIRCERCAEKARRRRIDDEKIDQSEVNFLV